MAKGNSGGKRATGGASVNATIGGASGGLLGGQGQDDNQQPVQQQQPVTPSMSASFNQFMSMTDDDKADVIDSMVKQGVPAHLSDTDFQKFIYNVGLNDKPQLVDDATLNSMAGKMMYRTVNAVYDRKNDINYRADEIAKQIQSGRITRTSDNGGSVYGRGIYFADSRSASTAYGSSRGDVKKTAVVSMKLNSNAKVIGYRQASNGVQSEIAKGTKLGKALSKVDRHSAESIYALTKGYNVIDAGNGYYNVLNRQAITMSKTVSKM